MEYQAKLHEKYMPVLICISQVLMVILIKSYMIQHLGYKVLETYKLGKRAERLSEWRKTFRITVNFSSNKMYRRSALQIALLNM